MTVTNASPTAQSNQKRARTLSTGRMVSVISDTGSNGTFRYSDDGITWTNFSADIAGWSNGSIDTYVDSGGTERIVAAWKQSGTGGSPARVNGQLYIMVGSFNTARTTITWGTAVDWPIATALDDYPDVVAQPSGTGGAAMMVSSSLYGGAQSVRCYAFGIVGNVPTYNTVTGSTGGANYGGAIHMWPSICLDSSGQYHIGFSAGATGAGKGVRYRTASWTNGTGWGVQSEVEVDNTRYIHNFLTWVVCRWDGTRVVIGGMVYSGSQFDLMLYETTNFTSFTTRSLLLNVDSVSPASSNRMLPGSMAIDTATGDAYFFGSPYAYGTDVMQYRKWTRATTTLGSLVITDYAGVVGIGTASTYPYAWCSGSKIRWIYGAGNNSPYTVKYDQLPV